MNAQASTVNSQLSPRLQVKPVKGNVTYMTKGAGEIMANVSDEDGNKKRKMPSISLTGEYFITDPFSENRTIKTQVVHALEYESKQKADGTSQLEPIKKRITIEGFLTINAETTFETYAYLERHPNNGSNKFREKNSPIKFYRKDAKKVKLDKAKQRLRTDSAIILLRNAGKEDIINIAKFINKSQAAKINLDQELTLLRDDVRGYADNNPELIIMGSADTFEKKKIQAQMAEDLGIIEFFGEDTDRNWMYGDEEIAHVDVGEDRYDVITKVFEQKENVGLYRKVMAELKKLKS